MDYLNKVSDKESFITDVKLSMDQTAMEKLEAMKKEIANEVLKAGE